MFAIISGGDVCWLFILVCLCVGPAIKAWMAVWRPDLYKAELDAKEAAKERRAKIMGPFVGQGIKVLARWLRKQ